MASVLEYDLVVIGSGPGGQKAAIAAAKLGKTVAVVERGRMLGGVCVNTGTIPSKTLREAVVYLTGMSQRELYGASYRVKEKITPQDLLARTTHVITKEQDVVRNQLMRNRVDLHTGPAIVEAKEDGVTLVGEARNVALRLAEVAAPGQVLCTEITYRLIRAHFDCTSLGPGRSRGWRSPSNSSGSRVLARPAAPSRRPRRPGCRR